MENRPRTDRQVFQSFGEFLRHAEKAPRPHVKGGSFGKSISYDKNWMGTETWEDAKNLAVNGWPEGLERVRKLTAPLYDRVSNRVLKPQPYFDVEGMSVDMTRLMEGDPECVLNFRNSEETADASGKHVHIMVNVFITSGFSAEDAFRRGAALCALVDILESTGRTVTVDALMGAWGRDEGVKIETIVPIKKAGETLNMEQLAFITCHVSMCRRLGFACWETSVIADRIGAIGQAGYYGQQRKPFTNIYGADIFVDSLNWRSTDPVAWLAAQLTLQGVMLDSEE